MDARVADQSFVENWAESHGVPKTARQKWRERGKVPHRYRLQIARDAAQAGVTVNDSTFEWTEAAQDSAA